MAEQEVNQLRTALVRAGFLDADVAVQIMLANSEIPLDVELFTNSPNADQSLRLISDLIATRSKLWETLDRDDQQKLAILFGHSAALAQRIIHDSDFIAVPVDNFAHFSSDNFQRSFIDCLSANKDAHGNLVTTLDWQTGLAALRINYNQQVSAIATLDVGKLGESSRLMNFVGEALANLADAVLEGALACARSQVPNHEICNLGIVAMGKSGGKELNYVSDVDVLFVVASSDPSRSDSDSEVIEVGTKLAKLVMQACSQMTPHGAIWQVDANLRPEGRSGALVRTLDSYLAYYQQWASGWEFQALMKARASAGGLELCQRFIDSISPLVWAASARPGFVSEVQEMRSMVIEQISVKDAERELKLGRGGLRDVEFAVQLLQLVHGRNDVMVRSPNTIHALEQLSTWGYIGREDASKLANAYRFIRTLEHRIQLIGMNRTHVLPADEQSLRQIGRSLGFFQEPATELITAWKQQANIIRRIHEKLFFRPLLEAVAGLNESTVRMSTDAALDRLEVLGYQQPQNALNHITALTSGVSRRATIQKSLLPVLLDWFSHTPSPDEGLLSFRKISDALGGTPWFLRLLRDESLSAQRLVTLLGTGRYVPNLLMRSPQSVQVLSDDEELVPKSLESLQHEVTQINSRHDNAEDVVSALRSLRRRELFRIGTCDTLGITDVSKTGQALSQLTDAVVSGAVQALSKDLGVNFPFLVIAMGRFGGNEISYASDVDVIYCCDAQTQKQIDLAKTLASKLTTLLGQPSTDPELKLDADLRPEGRSGVLVPTISAIESYYQRWSSPWEAQALLRARVVVGQSELSDQFLKIVNPIRYPNSGLTSEAVTEMRKLKARMETERLPRGIDPASHLKLGPGGLSDVEWLVQLKQLQYGYKLQQLRVTDTLAALEASQELKFFSQEDSNCLKETWLFISRLRNAMTLATGTSSDHLPKSLSDLRQVSYLLGYRTSGSEKLLEDYKRLTRRTRKIFVREFYGVSE